MTWVSSVGVGRSGPAGGCHGGTGDEVVRSGAIAGGSGTGPILRAGSARGVGGGAAESEAGIGAGVPAAGKGMAPVVRDGPLAVGSRKSAGGGPGIGLRRPGSASGGSGMAPVVVDEAAAAGTAAPPPRAPASVSGPSGSGRPAFPPTARARSRPRSAPGRRPGTRPPAPPARRGRGSGEGPQGMVVAGPPDSPPDPAGRTKKREVFPPIPSDGGAFHHSSGIEAGGASSWKSRGSGTEKRSVRSTGTSRSSCGIASDSGTECPSSSRARMLSGSSFSACSKSRRAPSRSPLIFSHSPASTSWLARALTAASPPVARAHRRRAPASAPAGPPSR